MRFGEAFDCVLDRMEGSYHLNKPTVSVIIPCRNYGRFLSEAIESVLQQTLKPLEIIVIDDDSTDNTEEVAYRYSGLVRYVYSSHKGNSTPSRAMNQGIRISKGEYIICLGADDKLSPDYIGKCTAELEKDRHVGFVWTGTAEFGYSNRIRLPRITRTHKFSTFQNPGGQLGAMQVRREVYRDVGMYDESLHGLEDWDYVIRMCLKGWKGIAIPDALHYCRTHSANLATRNTEELFHKYAFMRPYLVIRRVLASFQHPCEMLLRLQRKIIHFTPPDASQHTWVKEKRILKQVEGELILDCGCGNGRFGYLLRKQCGVVGLDIQKEYLLKAKQYYADVILCDLAYLPLNDHTFDTALAIEVIEHLPKARGFKFLRELRTIAEKLVLTTPKEFVKLYFGEGNPENHISFWTRNEILKTLKESYCDCLTVTTVLEETNTNAEAPPPLEVVS